MPERTAAAPGPVSPESDVLTEDHIRALVTTFYDRVRTDPVLASFFEDRLAGRWDHHLERMCDFWASVLLGARRFTGDPVGRHTGLPGLEPRHFARWIGLFDETAREVMPGHLARDVVGRARRMRVVLQGAACPGAPDPGSASPVSPRPSPSQGD